MGMNDAEVYANVARDDVPEMKMFWAHRINGDEFHLVGTSDGLLMLPLPISHDGLTDEITEPDIYEAVRAEWRRMKRLSGASQP